MAPFPTDTLDDEVLADVPAFRETLPPLFLRRYAAGDAGDHWSSVSPYPASVEGNASQCPPAPASLNDPVLPELQVRSDVLESSQLHTPPAVRMLLRVYQATHLQLAGVLAKRRKDRRFVDAVATRLSACASVGDGSTSSRSCIGMRDETGDVVVGPKDFDADDLEGSASALFDAVEIAPLPECMRGSHVTFFCPPASADQAAVAATVGDSKPAAGESAGIAKHLRGSAVDDPSLCAKWGADFEDSLYPDAKAFLEASEHLIGWIAGARRDDAHAGAGQDPSSSSQISLPMKRIPNLETPDLAHLLDGRNLLPQHVLDLCMHLWHCVARPIYAARQRDSENGEAIQSPKTPPQLPEVLAFYLPKLESEAEAAYMKELLSVAESTMKEELAREGLWLGTAGAYGGTLPQLRCVVVFENPRALFRAREIANALYPYMAGGSLGWHDFIASTARLFKNDKNYRIPRKTDHNLVVEVLRLSHETLAGVFGPGGGLKIGGAYGISPVWENGNACVVAVVGLVKDVFAQLRRGLDGFWIIDPAYVRPAMALVAAWKKGIASFFELAIELVEGAAAEYAKRHASAKEGSAGRADVNSASCWVPVAPGALAAGLAEIAALKETTDSPVLMRSDARFLRQMVAAHRLPSEVNETAEELKRFVRANTRQGLEYLFEYLCGGMGSASGEPNANVVLAVDWPVAAAYSTSGTVPLKVTDDLATLERSRWEIWAELRHGRVPLAYFVGTLVAEKERLRAVVKERKELNSSAKTSRQERWVDVVARLFLQLCTDFDAPVEFAPHMLLPFTIPSVRSHGDPWRRVLELSRDDGAENLQEPGVKFWGKGENRQTELFHLLAESSAHGSGTGSIAAASCRGPWAQELVNRCWSGVFDHTLTNMLETSDAASDPSFPGAALQPYLQAVSSVPRDLVSDENELPFRWLKLRSAADRILAKHPQVPGVTVCVTRSAECPAMAAGSGSGAVPSTEFSARQANFAAGFSDKSSGAKMTPSTWVQIATLSKTIGSAFSLEVWRFLGLDPATTGVNQLLRDVWATKSEATKQRLKRDLELDFFQLVPADGAGVDRNWPALVSLSHLVNHTALGSHYVFGFPADETSPFARRAGYGGVGKEQQESFSLMPRMHAILTNPEKYGYDPTVVAREPGASFEYSGGGFLVLQLLLELIFERPIYEVCAKFLRNCGCADVVGEASNDADATTDLELGFDGRGPSDAQASRGHAFARGFRDDGQAVNDVGRLLFPALAAGGEGTVRALGCFLQTLGDAYADVSEDGGLRGTSSEEAALQREGAAKKPLAAKLAFLAQLSLQSADNLDFRLSHDTAVIMLHCDMRRPASLQAREFMGASMGLGVFSTVIGPNRVACHRAANDGFRGLYLYCYHGPDAGKGVVIVSNGDNFAVPLNCELTARVMQIEGWRGVDFGKVVDLGGGSSASSGKDLNLDLPQEQIVNRGLKDLLFSAFNPGMPELNRAALLRVSPTHPLAALDILNANVPKARIVATSDQGFARAGNMLWPHVPVFDPAAFGRQGKVMDSWESIRHSFRPETYLTPLKPTIDTGKGFFSAAEMARLYHAEALDWAEVEVGLLSGGGLEEPASAVEAPFELINASTIFHDGNHAEWLKVEICLGGKDSDSRSRWTELIPRMKLEGHASHWILLGETAKIAVMSAAAAALEMFSEKANTGAESEAGSKKPTIRLRATIYPDGGFSRLRLYKAQEALRALKAEAANGGSLSLAREDVEPDVLAAAEWLEHALDEQSGEPPQQTLREERQVSKERSSPRDPGESGGAGAAANKNRYFWKRFGFAIGNEHKKFNAAENDEEDAASPSPNVFDPPARNSSESASLASTERQKKARAEEEDQEETMRRKLQHLTFAPFIGRSGSSVVTGTNFASETLCAKLLYVSNQHYGPATRLLSDETPLGMHDGFETRRSRAVGHLEEAYVQLGFGGAVWLAKATTPLAVCVSMVELDFRFFVNNNPREVDVVGWTGAGFPEMPARMEAAVSDSSTTAGTDDIVRGAAGAADSSSAQSAKGPNTGSASDSAGGSTGHKLSRSGRWVTVMERRFVKPYRASMIRVTLPQPSEPVRYIGVRLFPDGGVHRIKVFGEAVILQGRAGCVVYPEVAEETKLRKVYMDCKFLNEA